jgi:hypothetical protein
VKEGAVRVAAAREGAAMAAAAPVAMAGEREAVAMGTAVVATVERVEAPGSAGAWQALEALGWRMGEGATGRATAMEEEMALAGKVAGVRVAVKVGRLDRPVAARGGVETAGAREAAGGVGAAALGGAAKVVAAMAQEYGERVAVAGSAEVATAAAVRVEGGMVEAVRVAATVAAPEEATAAAARGGGGGAAGAVAEAPRGG